MSEPICSTCECSIMFFVFLNFWQDLFVLSFISNALYQTTRIVAFLQISKNAQIGISVEPLTSVQQQVSQLPTTPDGSTATNFRDFCTKMLENFMNYASSFSQSQSQMLPNPSEQYVPLSSLQSWYNNFNRRLEQNPYFWRS